MLYSLWNFFEKGNLNSFSSCFQIELRNAKLVWIILYIYIYIYKYIYKYIYIYIYIYIYKFMSKANLVGF